MPSPGSSRDASPSVTERTEEEFAAFYRANYQPALTFARSRASGADCEALVADSFLVAWQHHQVTGRLTRGWFYGVLRNKIGDFYRAARRREIPTQDLDGYQPGEDPAPRSEDHLDVLRAFLTLPPALSEALILVYWCDLTGTEAARALGVREGTLRVRLHRAHRAFLKAYDQRTDHDTILKGEVTPWTAQSD